MELQRDASQGLLQQLQRLEEENAQLIELNERTEALMTELKMVR